MGESVFEAILDFTIEKKYELERMYHGLATRPEFKQHADCIEEIARGEVLHARELEKLRFEEVSVELPASMLAAHGISEFFPKIDIDAGKSVAAILVFCSRQEEKTLELYQEILARARHPGLEKLFTALAREERKHIKALERKLERLKD